MTQESNRISALEARISNIERALRSLADAANDSIGNWGIPILDVDGDPVLDFDKRLDKFLQEWPSEDLSLSRARTDMRLRWSVRDEFLESKILEWCARNNRIFTLES